MNLVQVEGFGYGGGIILGDNGMWGVRNGVYVGLKGFRWGG